MKRIVAIIILCLSAVLAQAQIIAVTATITDSDGQTWNNGTFSVVVVSPNGTPFFGVTPVPTTVQKGVLSAGGALAVSLYNTSTITPTGALYQWTICSNTSAACSQFLAPVLVANESAQLSALVTVPRFPANPGTPSAYGYLDAEVTPIPIPGGLYYNVTLNFQRLWTGVAWMNGGGAISGIGGFGTTGTIPIFTGPTAIGNSPLSVSGGQVNSTDVLSAPGYFATSFLAGCGGGVSGYQFGSGIGLFYDGSNVRICAVGQPVISISSAVKVDFPQPTGVSLSGSVPANNCIQTNGSGVLSGTGAPCQANIILDVSFVNLPTGTAFPNNAFTTVSLPTVNTNLGGGAYNTGTSVYTVPVSGTYAVTTKIRFADGIVATPAGISYGEGVNTSNIDGPWFQWSNTQSSPLSTNSRSNALNIRYFHLTAGQTINMYAYVDNTGTPLNVTEASMNVAFVSN